MDTLFRHAAAEKTTEKRSRLPWGKKSNPLKTSILSSGKSKHSDEWHHGIDATAGVLHPSDPKLPWGFLRNHTDTYLKKKGKVNQAEADARLTILIEAHDARDIAIAAAAHAMTATGLRALLYADMHVAQGTYFGLKMWLQCLIAANEGNPASVTDLEALWARKLLPFATQGQRAAEWYLVGVSRALREMSIPNMTILPEFSILMNRAITDHSVQLEGYRLKNQWAAARDAVLWMVELARTSPPVTPPGHLLPEHIFDSQFPVWRMWASWQPRLERITRFAGLPAEALGVLSDLLALEGPDTLTGRGPTLREGLIMQHGGDKTFLQYRGIVVHVVDGTRECLYHMFERTAIAMEQLCSGTLADSKSQSKLILFQDLLVARPITSEHLDIFEATLQVQPSSSIDPYTTVQLICTRRENLGGEDITILRDLAYVLINPQSARLQTLLCQPWLFSGIEKCLQDRRAVVRSLIKDQKPWTDLAIELHEFCLALKACQQVLTLGVDTMRDLAHLPTAETMRTAVKVYEATKPNQGMLDAAAHLKHTTTENSAANTPHIRKDSAQPSPSSSPLEAKVELKFERHALQDVVEAFCIDRLLERGTIDQASQRTMTVILHIWENWVDPVIDADRQDLAILVVKETTGDHGLRSRCLAELAIGVQFLPPETLARDLINVIKQSSTDMSGAIVSLTKILHGRKATAQCWKDLLYMWLEGQASTPKDNTKHETVLDYSLKKMRAAEWLLFVGNLEILFPSDNNLEKLFPSDEIVPYRPEPPILHPTLRTWRTVLSSSEGTITRLETVLGDNREPIQCLLTCPSRKKTLIKILRALQMARGRPVEVLMQMVVGKLSAKGTNDFEVAECCVDLLTTNSTSLQACEQIWDAHHGQLDIPAPSMAELQNNGSESSVKDSTAKKPAGADSATRQHYAVPPVVVEAMVAGWIQDEDLEEPSKNAIISLSNLLNITVHHISVPQDVLREATKFWERIEAEMIKEAERLEAIQKSMKTKNPAATKAVLRQLGLPDSNPLEEEIAKLPAGVIDLVEKIGDSEVEISFPITNMNELQRNAMGVRKGAKNILVRLYIDFTDQRTPSRFCTHYDNDKDIETITHSFWTSKRDTKGPQDHVCNSPQSALIWQLNRVLHMQLRDGDINLVNLHTRVAKRIQDSAYGCISCGMSHNSDNARIRRSTPCDAFACSMLWYQLPLDVRIPELRNDIFAVDIMLMSVYAAAVSGRPELLPACPIRNLTVVKAILDLLPNLTVISHAINMSIVLKSYHPEAEKLISWACVHHRGLIATATGICKIPSLPKIHQFVFANASPRNESEYMKTQLPNNAKTQVLFHGTTFDRLPSILAQGLKICSGTALQRTGAAHGRGIYLAEDPATSLTYAPVTMSWRNSGLANTRLVLGCEVSGVSRSVGSTIHVVANEKSVMVRYLFVLPNGTNMPIPGHIVPAMGSAMSALRTGAV